MLGPQVDKVKTLQTANTKKGKRIIELRNKPSRKKTGKVRTEGGSGGEGCSGNKVIITNKVPNAPGSFIIYLNPKKTKNFFSCSIVLRQGWTTFLRRVPLSDKKITNATSNFSNKKGRNASMLTVCS
ncbi:hypothetical protein TNCV_2994681 [Trichonephila clavipes]|nr:hypothetical protein TNCV_2994681 [Trichonephila clavipes]